MYELYITLMVFEIVPAYIDFRRKNVFISIKYKNEFSFSSSLIPFKKVCLVRQKVNFQ